MKKELKGFIVGCIMTAIIGSGVAIASNQKNIDVYENNVTIEANGQIVNSPNFTYNDTTYVPLRAVLELMECHIDYDDATKTVKANNNYLNSVFYPFYLNGDKSQAYNSIIDTVTGITYVNSSIMTAADFDVSRSDEFPGSYMCMDNDKFVAFNTNSSSGGSSSLPAYSAAPMNITPSMFPLYLYSDEPTSVFLGILSKDKFDAESVSNTYGNYGSAYSDTSIFNNYGDYGSPYSSTSAFNKYATNPPLICDAYGNTLGRLTENTLFMDGYTWDEISAMMNK